MLCDTLDLSWKNGAWEGLGFDNPFSYNGSDNLVLEFRWQGDNDGSVYNMGYYTSGNRAVDAKSLTAEYGTPRNYMPRFRIYYSQAGIAESGPVRASGSLTAAPNPFRSGVTLSIPRTGGSEAAIYSATGRLVRVLRQSSILRWDGCDAAGRPVRVGAYFCRLGDGRAVRLVRVD